MPPVIFCDYQNTLDQPNSEILLDTLQEMKDNGAIIYMATNENGKEAKFYSDVLKEKGYDLFDSIISLNTFKYTKSMTRYWPAVQNKLGLNLEDIILLDDDPDNLGLAKRYGVNAISSIPSAKAAEELKATYQKLSNRPT